MYNGEAGKEVLFMMRFMLVLGLLSTGITIGTIAWLMGWLG